MSSFISSPPPLERSSSRIPGGFDLEDDDLGLHTDDANHDHMYDTSDHLPGIGDFSGLSQVHEEKHTADTLTNTVLEEREMHEKLMEMESSFMPEISAIARKDGYNHGADDTFLFGVPNTNLAARTAPDSIDISGSYHDADGVAGHDFGADSPSRTPTESFSTPVMTQEGFEGAEHYEDVTPEIPNTSALENMSSSPTAARTVSRVQSMATLGGYETADERPYPDSPTKQPQPYHDDSDTTPRKNESQRRLNRNASSVHRSVDGQSESTESIRNQSGRRPKYLNKRSSQARLSYDSVASSATEASDATLGADYAIQSGGAVSDSRQHRKANMTLSRQTSLGSMLSGVSGTSDDEGRVLRPSGAPDLSTLEEESPRSNYGDKRLDPSTPQGNPAIIVMPTDTVIANNVRDIEVPGTFARQYRQERNISPERPPSIAGMTPNPRRGLTLKEHRSTVEKLGKENFDLKMKIHFLDQALQRRSEDGVKEIITENVQLKSDRLRLEKDNLTLRKQVRDLQKKLDEKGDQDSPNADQGYETDEERSPTFEEELIYLRERVETNEIEMEKLRSDNIAKETEKRKLAEMVRSLGDTKAGTSDVGSREERDMWKDMLEAETIAREQSEEDNKRLREEISKLRQDSFGAGRSHSRKNRLGGTGLSRSSSIEATTIQHAELDRLRHEVSELQKMIGAQASTLTSRNKEKERLYQEIEDLKLGRMGGVRSVAGDSILDRSASRARSYSRASNGTRISRYSDHERESLETRINELRDEVSQLKLENQDIRSQFDEAVAELDAVDAQAQADADQFNEEFQILTQERDNALQDAEEQDRAFQQLKNEAQEEIDGLGDELDVKIEECIRFEGQLKAQAENVKALQAEMRSASEGLIRLEEDAQQNLARYQVVKSELDDANRELENMENTLTETESKNQRLTVQQQSSQHEIAFLREEQDVDKIKIGDLESLLKKTHLNLDLERDKTKDLERGLDEQRHQREVVASQEKQDVQKMMNDLNREASAAKEELRSIRKALSSKELESNTYKERLGEMEDNLRHILGDPNGTRSSLISAVTKMQQELDQTTVELDSIRRRLDERETTLSNRDQLLESSGLEYRKLADALDRERQARRQDKHSFEQALKSHQQSARALTANSSRIAELEQARQGDRKRLAQLEGEWKEQLSERNRVLLTIWKKLSAMCGPDWAHNNSLINGNLPSQEVIGNMLFWPGFSRNILLAAKQVEGVLTTFKDKIKRVERELWKEYQTLEHNLELRTKKLERIEESWESMKLRQMELDAQAGSQGTRTPRSSKMPELSKLKGENRLLKAELQLLQQQQQHYHNSQFNRHGRGESRGSAFSGALVSNDAASAVYSMDGAVNGGMGVPARSSSMRRRGRNGDLQRHHTTGIVEHLVNVHGPIDENSVRTASISSQTSGHYNRDRNSGAITIPTGPFHAPSNSNFSIPPPSRDGQPNSSANGPGSDAGSINTGFTSGTQGMGQDKWIHRLRELERRLKAEREMRLVDRSGMRRRLEERDVVNEELRRELERERVKKSHGFGGDSIDAVTKEGASKEDRPSASTPDIEKDMAEDIAIDRERGFISDDEGDKENQT